MLSNDIFAYACNGIGERTRTSSILTWVKSLVCSAMTLARSSGIKQPFVRAACVGRTPLTSFHFHFPGKIRARPTRGSGASAANAAQFGQDLKIICLPAHASSQTIRCSTGTAVSHIGSSTTLRTLLQKLFLIDMHHSKSTEPDR